MAVSIAGRCCSSGAGWIRTGPALYAVSPARDGPGIPIEGDPADVTAIVAAYAEWLATSNVNKLFIKAEPGALLGSGTNLETDRAWPNQTEVTVAGVHFCQENTPDEIGRAIAEWMRKLG